MAKGKRKKRTGLGNIGSGKLKLYEQGKGSPSGTAKNTAIDTVLAVIGGVAGAYIGKFSAGIGVAAVGASHYLGIEELRPMGLGMITGVTATSLGSVDGFSFEEGKERSMTFLKALKSNVGLGDIGSIQTDERGRYIINKRDGSKFYLDEPYISPEEATRKKFNITEQTSNPYILGFSNRTNDPNVERILRPKFAKINPHKALTPEEVNNAFTVAEAIYAHQYHLDMLISMGLAEKVRNYFSLWRVAAAFTPVKGSGVYLNTPEGRAERARDNAELTPNPWKPDEIQQAQETEEFEEEMEGLGRIGRGEGVRLRKEAAGMYAGDSDVDTPFGELVALAGELAEEYSDYAEQKHTLSGDDAQDTIKNVKEILYGMNEIAIENPEFEGIGSVVDSVLEDIHNLEAAAVNGLAGFDDFEEVMEGVAGAAELVLAGASGEDLDALAGGDDDEDELFGDDDDDDLSGEDDDDDELFGDDDEDDDF